MLGDLCNIEIRSLNEEASPSECFDDALGWSIFGRPGLTLPGEYQNDVFNEEWLSVQSRKEIGNM
jgi:hypothetical protein